MNTSVYSKCHVLVLFIAVSLVVHIAQAADVHPAEREIPFSRYRPNVDFERRSEMLGRSQSDQTCDLEALVGLPDEYSKALSAFTESVLAAIDAVPITRRRFYHNENHDGIYPLNCNPVYEYDVRVPVLILPSPSAVELFSRSTVGPISIGRSC